MNIPTPEQAREAVERNKQKRIDEQRNYVLSEIRVAIAACQYETKILAVPEDMRTALRDQGYQVTDLGHSGWKISWGE